MAAPAGPTPGTVPLDNILNFRDVGQHINHLTNRHLLHPGLLYRSARPDAASAPDRATLTDTLHLHTIIDLRTPTEHAEALAKHQQTHLSHLQIPGPTTQHVNLNGAAYTSALLAQLTWPQTLRLYASYALGDRKAAIAILATNVMTPRGLAGLAIDTLTHSAAVIGELFTGLLARRDAYPVLLHCTQGKDRTGLAVLLLLLLCEVPVEAIAADYMASDAGLAAEREEKVREVQSVGFPAAFADCEAGWVESVVGWVEGQGGVAAYLEGKCGVGRGVQEEIRHVLMG